MSDFIQSLISRHTQSDGLVKPRVRGLFEPVNSAAGVFAANPTFESEGTNNNDSGYQEQSRVSPDTDLNTVTSRSREDTNNATQPIFHQTDTAFRSSVSPLTVVFDPINQQKQNDPGNKEFEQFFSQTPEIVPNSTMPDLSALEENRRRNNRLEMDNEKEAGIRDSNNLSGSKGATAGIAAFSTMEPIKPVLNKSNSPVPEFQNPTNIMSGLNGELSWFHNLKSASDQFLNHQSPPVIKVTIGRIEVRASTQPAPLPNKAPTVAKPQMSLEDYLKKQNNNSK